MLDLRKRLENLEKYCSDENTELYFKLKKCNDKATQMNYMEYLRGEQEHNYSNLYSCVYDFKKENDVLESMEDLMQLMKDICFSVDRRFQVHNFKVINHIYFNRKGVDIMTKEQLMNNLYDIITNNIEDLEHENGANMFLTEDNKIYIQLEDTEQMFVLNIEEEK